MRRYDDHFAQYFDEIPTHTREFRNWGGEGVALFPAIIAEFAIHGKHTPARHLLLTPSNFAGAQPIPVRSLSIGFHAHLSFDYHHVIMIAINASHLFCFSNILQLLAGCGGERMWGRSAAERGPTFSKKTPPRRRGAPGGMITSKASRFAPAFLHEQSSGPP